jgi:hypothetical protein
VITQEQLSAIGTFAHGQLVSDQVVDQLRERYPEIHFTYCMDDDVVAANPVFEDEAFNLYLIDSRDHCLCFTQDLDIATGVVLAEIEDDA